MRKRILDVTSTKKRDNMLSCYSFAASPNAVTGGGLGILASGANALGVVMTMWISTARAVQNVSTGDVRSRDVCFIRGLKENYEMRTSTSNPWEWRRIAFTLKGSLLRQDTPLYNTTGGTQGYRRLQHVISDGSTIGVSVTNFLFQAIFDGTVSVDWYDPIQAKTNPRVVTILSDVKRTIQSGNDTGVLRQYKTWLPVNKNLVYDDTEDGQTELTSPYSTSGKPGCGDVYILDIYKPWDPTGQDQLYVTPQSCLYWHEK